MLLGAWSRTSLIHSRFICNSLQQRILQNAIVKAGMTARSTAVDRNTVRISPVAVLTHRLYTTNSGPLTNPQPSGNVEEEMNNNDTDDNDPGTSERLRKVLRKVPFPVVVVSTSSPHDPSLRRGITVSSFSSISLQPTPLIAFCVKLPSRASTILHESDRFVVQFLASDQIAHSVAFSSSVPPPPTVAAVLSESGSILRGDSTPSYLSKTSRSRVPQDKDIDELVSEASRQTLIESRSGQSPGNNNDPSGRSTLETDPDPFEVLGYRTDPESNLPVLLNTLGAIRCRTHKVLVVGDHEMWIGQVETVLHGETPDQQEPLLYHDRSYRRVGRRIV